MARNINRELSLNEAKAQLEGNKLSITGSKGSLDMSIHDLVKVEIKDQSDGIPEKYIHRLTERFFRVDKSRSKAIEGTGLGLTIVKHILNKHRGNIEISSTLNKGSIFTIQLPEAPIS